MYLTRLKILITPNIFYSTFHIFVALRKDIAPYRPHIRNVFELLRVHKILIAHKHCKIVKLLIYYAQRKS